MSVATTKGDGGFTDLYNAAKAKVRVRKDDPRIEFIGTLDELDAALALAERMCTAAQHSFFAAAIAEVRKGLVCAMAANTAEIAAHTAWLERQLAVLEEKSPVRGFVRSWTNTCAAFLNAARAVCRRAERRLVSALETADTEDWALMLPWLNRLSDMLFLLAVSAEHGKEAGG